jgi:purine-binding chemotaxis protein CheW
VVDRIVHAVEVTALPGAPDIVLGVIDVEGNIVPVLNIRRRLRLPEREIGASDQIIIAQTAGRTVALIIDEAHDVIEREQAAIVGSEVIVAGLEHIQGVVKLDDGLVLIHDLDTFLSLHEARTLDEAMERTT